MQLVRCSFSPMEESRASRLSFNSCAVGGSCCANCQLLVEQLGPGFATHFIGCLKQEEKLICRLSGLSPVPYFLKNINESSRQEYLPHNPKLKEIKKDLNKFHLTQVGVGGLGLVLRFLLSW